MMINQEKKLEAEIIAKIRAKKKLTNSDDFLVTIYAVGKELASPEVWSVYTALMKDLKRVESLKKEQQQLTSGLEKKYTDLLSGVPQFLDELLPLKERAREVVQGWKEQERREEERKNQEREQKKRDKQLKFGQ